MDDAMTTMDLGVRRGLAGCADRDGFFTVLAIDHPAAMIVPPDTTDVHAAAVAIKTQLARAVAPYASAVLVDPDLGLPACVATGALPGDVGLMLCIEGEEYQREPDAHRTSDIRPGWSVAQIRRAGGDAVKLLWRYRHEVAEADAHRAFVRDLAEQCRAESLPFVVEPIWVPMPGESLDDPQVRARRVRGVVDYARLSQDLGADVVKTEFPGWVGAESAEADAARACAELDAGLDVPWLLLSAGVTYDAFRIQTEIAARAGASGFIAGRALWDAAVTPDPQRRDAGVATAVARFTELRAVVAEHGRPWRPQVPADRVAEQYPPAWYAT